MHFITLMSKVDISKIIWDMKYRHKSYDGQHYDKSIEDTWVRVATSLSSQEINKKYWFNSFYEAFKDFKLIPAGRISRGAGTNHNVTMINTFVMGLIPDDLNGILNSFTESALTLRQGGGIGCNFSQVRPRGTLIKGVESASSGVVPFMEMWDQMCNTIMRGGVYRGAMMAMLSCDHPDIEEFIEVKSKSDKLTRFNLSILVTNDFIKAVQNNEDWVLKFANKIYKKIKARNLWDTIMKITYKYSEPGVIFIDKINSANNLSYCEQIIGTNSCGEQPMPEYGSCPLASINLAKLIIDPFTSKAILNIDQLKKLISVGIRMLDNVLDQSKYPLGKQENEAKQKRRVGLGITGLADAFVMCGVKYGSKESIALLEEWMKIFKEASYLASANLAKEKGPFPKYDKNKFLKSNAVKALDADTKKLINKYGIRNGTLNSIPPTGTTSLYAGNISSGIEPIYSLESSRKILLPNGESIIVNLRDYAYSEYKNNYKSKKTLPKYFSTSESISPKAHIMIQSAAQKYIDASISKTVICQEKMSFKSFKDVYLMAYRSGCKGCTTYRLNNIRKHVIKPNKS